LNSQTDPVPLFPDLLGFRAVPREHVIDWTLFFDSPGAPPAQRSKKMDGKLVRALIELPVAVTGECEIEDYHSLAVRDLQRGQGIGLPSGEEVARHIGVTPLTAEQVGIVSTGWKGETPLWYYILREADACTAGNRLARWEAELWRRFWLDSLMRTRHRIVRTARNGVPRKRSVNC
jgi:hypothetical protein